MTGRPSARIQRPFRALDLAIWQRSDVAGHDAGREDRILQVRYEGPANQFGWLIPVPNRPEVAVASMGGFYELSRFTQEYVHGREQWRGALTAGPPAPVPAVTIVEYQTVGDYDVALLATESADSLTAWLDINHFAIRRGFGASPAVLS